MHIVWVASINLWPSGYAVCVLCRQIVTRQLFVSVLVKNCKTSLVSTCIAAYLTCMHTAWDFVALALFTNNIWENLCYWTCVLSYRYCSNEGRNGVTFICHRGGHCAVQRSSGKDTERPRQGNYWLLLICHLGIVCRKENDHGSHLMGSWSTELYIC